MVILLSLTAHFLRPDTVVSVCLAAESLSGRVALEIHFLDTGVCDHAFRFILCFEHKKPHCSLLLGKFFSKQFIFIFKLTFKYNDFTVSPSHFPASQSSRH